MTIFSSSSKKVLIILTNESFIPSSSETGKRNPEQVLPQPKYQEDGPVMTDSPLAWTPSRLNIQNPPNKYREIKNVAEAFDTRHKRTGADIYELGYLWLTLTQDLKKEVVFCSPRGGPIAADPFAVENLQKDDRLRETLSKERRFMSCLGHTYPISWINPEEFGCVIIPGGHGTMFDLPEHMDVACVISEIYKNDGFVAAIGHGVSALLNVRKERRGDYLVKGREITCFSKEEEKKIEYVDYLPWFLEDRLRENGAKVKVSSPFEVNIVTDERLLTAQNAPSIHEFIKTMKSKFT